MRQETEDSWEIFQEILANIASYKRARCEVKCMQPKK